jgi:hypothetical protein
MSEQYISQTPNKTPNSPVHYSAQSIAEIVQVSEATIRLRHFEWICKVAPVALLKDEKGYTELAKQLFVEFASVDHGDRSQWVEDAKSRYSPEWGNAGIIDGELMPSGVGGVLALIQANNSTADLSVAGQLQDLDEFVKQINEAEANFSQAELSAFRARGAKRGIERFKIETQTELEVLNHLREKRLQGGNNV